MPTVDPVCALCGGPVDITLPARYTAGPSVEHTLPIRSILAMTQTNKDALDLACDTSLWALAHSRCQSQQGAAVTNNRHRPRRGSRDW